MLTLVDVKVRERTLRKVLASHPMPKGRTGKTTKPGPPVQRGVTTLILDTNVLLVGQGIDVYPDDGGVLHAVLPAAGAGWNVIVPLVVITELDGLMRAASPKVKRGAKAALDQLSSLMRVHSTLKVQSSRNNFLTDPSLPVRNEQIDFKAGDVRARSLDDVILRIALWHEQRPSPDVEGMEADVPRALLVTLDTNLRVKARAYGVAAATPNQLLARLSRPSG